MAFCWGMTSNEENPHPNICRDKNPKKSIIPRKNPGDSASNPRIQQNLQALKLVSKDFRQIFFDKASHAKLKIIEIFKNCTPNWFNKHENFEHKGP